MPKSTLIYTNSFGTLYSDCLVLSKLDLSETFDLHCIDQLQFVKSRIWTLNVLSVLGAILIGLLLFWEHTIPLYFKIIPFGAFIFLCFFGISFKKVSFQVIVFFKNSKKVKKIKVPKPFKTEAKVFVSRYHQYQCDSNAFSILQKVV